MNNVPMNNLKKQTRGLTKKRVKEAFNLKPIDTEGTNKVRLTDAFLLVITITKIVSYLSLLRDGKLENQ